MGWKYHEGDEGGSKKGLKYLNIKFSYRLSGSHYLDNFINKSGFVTSIPLAHFSIRSINFIKFDNFSVEKLKNKIS